MLSSLAAATMIDEEELMTRLKAAVFRSRTRMREFFADYDPLRSGKMSEAKFRTALQASNVIPLREEEVQSLTARYKRGHLVDYEMLMQELDSVFTTRQMERDPGATVTDFTPTLISPLPILPGNTMNDCDALIGKIAHLVRTRRILLRPPFADFAKNVNSPLLEDQVTHQQFRSGISSLGLELSEEEVELLQARFSGSAPNYVNFVAFACAVDRESESLFSTREPRSEVENMLHSGFRSERISPQTFGQPGRPPTVADAPRLPNAPATPELSALISKLQDKALQRRIRLGEFFRDHDKHNDGTVTQPQAVKVISIAFSGNPAISEAEFEIIVQYYSRLMPHGARHIEWRKLCADVDVVFTASNLLTKPREVPGTKFLQQDPCTLSGADEEDAQNMLNRLRHFVKTRRVHVKPLFQDFEAQVNSPRVVDHITRAQVVQSFSRLGIELTEREMSLLFMRYDTLGDGNVNYVAMVRDIDDYESFSARETKHHALPQDPQFGVVSRGIPHGGFLTERTVKGPLLNMQPGRPPTTNDTPGSPKYSATLHHLLSNLSGAASRHRVRIEEAFCDFDRHRDGTVTVPQFAIGMQTAWGKYAPVSERDFQSLVGAFSINKPGATHVKWREFCEAVNGADRAGTTVGSVPLTDAGKAALEAVLARFRHICHTRRMLVRPFFDDLQASRRSMNKVDHVTRAQCTQCLSSLGLEATAAELELIHKEFDDLGDGHVNYVALARAVDPSDLYIARADGRTDAISSFNASGGFSAPKVQTSQPGRPPLVAEFPRLVADQQSQPEVTAILKRLLSVAKKFDVNLEDFFVDQDRHRHGIVTINHFRAGLNAALKQSYVRADLTTEELDTLEKAYLALYSDGAPGIAWRRFCADIDVVRTLPQLEYSPAVDVEQTQASFIAGGNQSTLSGAEESAVSELLGRIRERFRIRKVLAKPPFADFAASVNSPLMVDHVTRQQFVQGLSKLGVEPSQSELALLFRKFDDAGDGSVNYIKFTTAVDLAETFSTRQAGSQYKPLFTNGFRKVNAAYAGL